MLQGVYIAYRKDKTPYYRSSIHYNGKHVSLGSFDTEEEAHNAYKEAYSIYKSNETTIENYTNSEHILSDDKIVTILIMLIVFTITICFIKFNNCYVLHLKK